MSVSRCSRYPWARRSVPAVTVLMVLDWYPITTLTTPEVSDNDSSEQPDSDAATTRVAAAADHSRRARLLMKRPEGSGDSANEIRHIDRDGTGRAAGRTRAAVPALVDMHERFAGVGVDRQRVKRTDLDTERAAVDTQRLVDGH